MNYQQNACEAWSKFVSAGSCEKGCEISGTKTIDNIFIR
jgi:hypothetical protein